VAFLGAALLIVIIRSSVSFVLRSFAGDDDDDGGGGGTGYARYVLSSLGCSFCPVAQRKRTINERVSFDY